MVLGILSYIWNWLVLIAFHNINIVNRAWTDTFFFLFYFILPLIPLPPQKKFCLHRKSSNHIILNNRSHISQTREYMANTMSVKDSVTSRCSVWGTFCLKDWRGYDIIEGLSLEEEEQCCHLAFKSYKTRGGIFLMSMDSKWPELHWAGRLGHLGYRQAKGSPSIRCLT